MNLPGIFPIGALDQQLNEDLRGNFEYGESIADTLSSVAPKDHRAAFNRGWFLMRNGDLLGGFEHIDRGRKVHVFGSPALNTVKPIFDIAKHDPRGKTILLRAEGGLGDEIINVRFAKELSEMGAKVVVSASDGLMSVFSRVQGVSAVIKRSSELLVEFDYWIPAMSAVLHLGLTYDTLMGKPYIVPETQKKELWSKTNFLKKPGLKIGLRWAGNPQFEHEQHRKFPAPSMLALSNIPGATFYSLQRDNDLLYLPENIVDLQNVMREWEDTLAIVSQLDLLITSDTSVGHLSAAAGVPTWTILPILPYYIWALPKDTTPWYDSVRLFRQTEYGNWSGPFEKIREELSRFIQEKNA